MTWKRGFLGIGVCALILLGLSTNASATITGTGCIIAGQDRTNSPCEWRSNKLCELTVWPASWLPVIPLLLEL